MLHPVTPRVLAVAACGWLLACDAAALTLGRASGAVLIGRPLELVIPARLDDAGESPCASADLFYGETLVRGTPSVRWEPGTGVQGLLRLRSPEPVNEPMITVYLRVGCGSQTTTRRYVMLSEPVPDNEPEVRARSAAVQPPLVAVPAGRAGGSSPRAPAGRGSAPDSPLGALVRDADAPLGQPAAIASHVPAARDVAPAPAPRARREAARAPVRTEAPRSSRPRLKLEPLDLVIEHDPILRLTSELRTQVATDPQQRAAAAALWQVLQRGPDGALQDAVRLQNVERELRSLQQVTQQNAAAVAQLRAHVERTDSNRGVGSLVVLALGLALAAVLGWLAWRWHRASQVARVGRWFQVHGEPVRAALPQGSAAAAAAPERGSSAPAARAAAARHAAAAPPAPNRAAAADFQASRGGSLPAVGVQEVIDVHDKADFFLSIGEPEQAVAVLEAHVHGQVETSALAWMDLLELYYKLGRRAEFERVRGEFRQRFAGQVPEFEQFGEPTASLENYGRALSRIVALWPSQRVLDVIEESIFRKPGLPGAEPFSLEAYRELVLLYHVAQEIAPQDQEAQDTSRPGPLPDFPSTSLQPLNGLDAPEPGAADSDHLLIPPASPRLGLDIDLGGPAPDEDKPRDGPMLDLDVSASDALGTGAKTRPA